MESRSRRLGWLLVLIATHLCGGAVTLMAEVISFKISSKPRHDGRIDPKLFGNFVELLDDLVPGMWAESLNDRGFEGVTPAANWVYYDGSPTFCDRAWDRSDDWSIERKGAFNGSQCARISARKDRPSGLTQSGLAVKTGAGYQVSMWVRGQGDVRIQAVLKAKRPSGSFQELAVIDLGKPSNKWTRVSGLLRSMGTTDRAVFEIIAHGEGTLWVDKVSLLPEQNVLGWRDDVVQAIKESRPSVVRWGGSVVDPGAYRWKGGIGDRDLRIPFPNTNWGRIDSNDVGIGEFCQFCELVQAEPLVCVSFSDGAESAADLVEYCNGSKDTTWGTRRAADGRPEPYHVKYWQLGNELSGDDATYIEKCQTFIAAMKKVDSRIAIISSFPSRKVIDELGKDLSHLAPHHYTRDLAACEADFRKLATMISQSPGRGHLRLAVTEWNFTAGDWGLLRGKMLTLEGALWNAQYLNLICRYANTVEMACRSNMTNSYCSGIIGTTPEGLIKRPSYFVMKLYADHAKAVPLEQRKSPAGIDLIACVDENRQKLCIFVVNLRREPVTLHLDLTELGDSWIPLAAEAVCDTRDMRQPDVMNHEIGAERVRTVVLEPSGKSITLPAFSACALDWGRR
jgi:alpha-N-arabinofuranosidase